MMKLYSDLLKKSQRYVGNSIDVVTGAYIEERSDFPLPKNISIEWWRYYNSSYYDINCGLGKGFRHNFYRELFFCDEGVTYVDQIGNRVLFDFPLRDHDKDYEKGITLERVTERHYRIHEPNRPKAEFLFEGAENKGRFVELLSDKGWFSLKYGPEGKLQAISMAHNRGLELEWRNDFIVAIYLLENDMPTKEMTRYSYSDDGHLINVTDFTGKNRQYAYDKQGRLKKSTNHDGFAFYFRFDFLNRCVLAQAEDQSESYQLEHIVDDKQTIVTQADGGQWLYMYSNEGEVTKVAPSCDEMTLNQYEDSHSVKTFDSTLFSRQLLPTIKRQKAQKIPVAHHIGKNLLEWEYGYIIPLPDRLPDLYMLPSELPSEAFSIIRKTDRLGPLLPEVKKDFQRRITTETFPNGHQRAWSFDTHNNVITFVDCDGSLYHYEYSPTNQLIRRRDPLKGETCFEYGKNNKLEVIIDAGGTKSEYKRDFVGRLSEVHYSGRLIEKYIYDAEGILIEKRDSNGKLLIKYGHIIGQKVYNSIQLDSGDSQKLFYDEEMRLIRTESHVEHCDFEYNTYDKRILDHRDGHGVLHTINLGVLGETQVFGKFVIHYEHPDTNKSVIIDPTGRKHNICLIAPGVVIRDLSENIREVCQYDRRGKCLAKILYNESPEIKPWTRKYTYSETGDLLTEDNNLSGQIGYVHDRAHRLVEACHGHEKTDYYEHDLAGNLLKKPGLQVSSITGNAISVTPNKRYLYNNRGHVQTIDTDTHMYWFYYDSLDQLIKIKCSDGQLWEACYDVLGRRTQKTYDGNQWKFFWDSDRLISEIFSDGTVRIYIYPDEYSLIPMMCVDYESINVDPTAGNRSYFITNQIGCPIRVIDSKGQPVWDAKIEPYGVAHVVIGQNFHQPLRWPGHYYDQETGLQYNRFRYYSPEIGRYIQRNPLGINGNINLYAYCASPLTEASIRGLETSSLEPRCAHSYQMEIHPMQESPILESDDIKIWPTSSDSKELSQRYETQIRCFSYIQNCRQLLFRDSCLMNQFRKDVDELEHQWNIARRFVGRHPDTCEAYDDFQRIRSAAAHLEQTLRNRLPIDDEETQTKVLAASSFRR